jgi:hypothetical protein
VPPCSTYCRTSSPRTSVRFICSLRNSMIRRRSGGTTSATKISRSLPAVRFTPTRSQIALRPDRRRAGERGRQPPPPVRCVSPRTRLGSSRDPERRRVCGVVEQLSDDLATKTRVRAALDFYERRNAVLVEEEMVNTPPVCPVLFACDPKFALHEQPSPTRLIVLISRQEIRMLREQLLQHLFRLIRLSDHFDEVVSVFEVDRAHSAAHRTRTSGYPTHPPNPHRRIVDARRRVRGLVLRATGSGLSRRRRALPCASQRQCLTPSSRAMRSSDSPATVARDGRAGLRPTLL